MKKFSKLTILLLTAAMVLSGCGSSSNVYGTYNGNDYTTINKIDGIVFSVPASITKKSTAVTRVADDQGFESSGVYSYANGSDEYMLFCMDELIILAQKGTKYNFSETDDKLSALDNSGVLDSWCSADGKKLTYSDSTSDGVYKIVANVKEEISITTELFGDYVGKLATLESGDDEWSVLVGVKADSVSKMTSRQESVVNTIVNSARVSESEDIEETEYDFVGGEGAIEENTDSAETEVTEETDDVVEEVPVEEGSDTIEETVEEETPQEEIPVEEEVVSETSEEKETDSESEVTEPSEIISAEEDSEEDVTTETETENETSAETVEDTEEEEIASSTSEETVAQTKENHTATVHDNQNVIYTDQDTIKKSSVYSMLSLMDVGIFGTQGVIANDYEIGAVQLTKIYSGDEAKKIIELDAANSDYYKYSDAPDGYHYEVAEYSLFFKKGVTEDTVPYVDVKMLGMNGEALVFKGVTASSRTYEALTESSYDDTVKMTTTMRVFYAVPNGCKEYILKFGDGNVNDTEGRIAAYYRIPTNG